jgi:hypothetical protein
MPVSANEPRLPLEPEEYPLYRPPRRIGCSGLTIVTLITIAAFALLLWRVTPDMAKAITDIPRGLLQSGTEEPDDSPGASSRATQTALSLPTATANIVVNPTPVIEYVKVANTGGSGVRLRVEPRSNARSIINVGEGALFQVIGPDQPDEDNPANIWRNVQLLPPDGRKGWVLSRFLVPDPGP